MRVYKRINDLFEVELPDGKRYFQYLGSDSTWLGGDVIVIYENKYDCSQFPESEAIVNGPVEYCCHTNINLGVKSGLWKRYGNASACLDLSKLYFRNYVDEAWIGMQFWHVWRMNEAFMTLDTLPEQYADAYYTMLYSPYSIYDKILHGKFGKEDY